MSTFVFLSPAVGGGETFYTFSVPVSSSFVQNFALLPLPACQVVFFVCWFGSPPPLPSVCFIPSSIYYLFLSFTASKDLRGEKEKTKLFFPLCASVVPNQPPPVPNLPAAGRAVSGLSFGAEGCFASFTSSSNKPLSAGRGAAHRGGSVLGSTEGGNSPGFLLNAALSGS